MSRKIIMFHNKELDRITGGIPFPSMVLIEGEGGSGKSLVAYQLTWGSLVDGLSVRFITSENTIKGLIRETESMYGFSDYFIRGKLRITEISARGIKWDEKLSRHYLKAIMHFLRKINEEVAVIDSLTHIIVHAKESDVLEFFTTMRNWVDSMNKFLVVTLHTYSIDKSLMTRIRSICDSHIVLKLVTLPTKDIVRMLQVNKVRGAIKTVDNAIFFKADTSFGLKVLPVSYVKVK
ncbi:MAG: flagellar accessory protein FlaH [Thermoprotei archaeon]|nr:MAG: flagellar accessory protein FlaH [Thermoprotei archaeon]RLF25592.1 MAG: flagellar accessory protein FlaH [Thermoprotei archaeon]